MKGNNLSSRPTLSFKNTVFSFYQNPNLTIPYQEMAPTATETSSYQGHLSNGDSSLASKGYKPTHPGSFEVVFEGGNYNSKLIAKKVSRENDRKAKEEESQSGIE